VLESAVQMKSKLRALVAAAAIAAFALTAAAPAAEAVPSKFWGVVPQATPNYERLQRLKRGGVDSMRIPIFWNSVQPVQGGVFEWASVDPIVASAASAGIEVLPYLSGAPTWAVPSDPVISSHPPRFLPVRTGIQRVGWTRLIREAILRYGPRGSFWAENPTVPKRPIRVWQIWNEQNFKYFVARPNPAEYGKLVNLSHEAVKAADPGARIVLGGMFARPIEALIRRGPRQAYFATDFLMQMYKRTPSVKTKFHGVALHPYTGTYKRLPSYIGDLRHVLQANRDGDKGIWLTELGWSSQPAESTNSFAKGRSGQARELKGAFDLLRDNQRRWNVKRIYWFAVEDQAGSCNFCGGTGLFTEAFAPKPSWRAFVGFAGGRP
jgi:polysaccharide biosynthesis protein PslG